MDAEGPNTRGFELRYLWIAFGIVLEFLIIPRELRGTYSVLHQDNLFTKGDFYYALISPVVVWWFFRHLVPEKVRELTQKRVRFLIFIFGFYVASATRAILTAFFAIHVGAWTLAH